MFDFAENFDLVTILYSLIILLLLFIHHRVVENKRKPAFEWTSGEGKKCTKSENDLPSPKSLPFIGCKFALDRHPHKILAEVAEKDFNGGIFRIKAGCRRFVVFTRLEDVEHVAKFYPEELFGKPHSFTTGKISLGAHNDTIERWKKRRAYTNAGLKHLEKHAIDDIMSQEMDHLISIMNSLADLGEDVPRDIRHEITYCISRVLYKMSYSGKIDEDTDVQLRKMVHDLPDYTTSMGSFSRFDMFPFMRFFFRNQYKRFVRFNCAMKEFCRKQKRKAIVGDGPMSLWSFFTDKFARSSHCNSANKMLDFKESLFDGLEDIIRAGTESTSLLIQWLVAYAVKYVDVQQKMQTEIDSLALSKRKRKLDLDDIQDLPYCRAVLAETHRFCSLNPFLKRQLTGDIVTKDGYLLRQGTCLLFNNWALNFDKSCWDDPDKFNPERFLDDNKNFHDSKFNKMLSFGFGKRRCIGVQTGRSLCFLAAVNIFQRFQLRGEEDIDIEPVDGIGLSSKPFTVYIRRR